MAQLFDSAYYDAPADAVAPDNAAILTDLYRTIFNREPDQSGFDFWLGALNQGYTPEFVRDQFLASPEYADIQAQKSAPASAPTPAPVSTPLDPLFADPRYIEAKQLAQEYGAFPVTIGDTVYNVLADGAVETIKPTDSTMQGTSTGAELGLFSPTGEAIVAPYFDPSYGEKSIGDLIVNASLAAAVGGLVGPAGAGLLSTPAAAAVGSGFSTLGATGDYESAVKAAALAGLSAGAGEALGLTGGAATGADFTAADAAQLAAQGIPEDQIVTILQQSGVPVSQAIDAAFNAVGNQVIPGSAAGLSELPTLSLPSGLEQVQVTGGALSSVSPLLESVAAGLPTVMLPTPAPLPAPAPTAAPATEQVQVQGSTTAPAPISIPEVLATLFPSFVPTVVPPPTPAPAPVPEQVVVQAPTAAPITEPAPVAAPVAAVLPTLFTPTPAPAPVPTAAPTPAPATEQVQVTGTPTPAPASVPGAEVIPGLLGSTVVPSPTPAPATEQVQVESTKATGETPEKPDALTPVYVPPTVDIPIPEVTTKPTLSNADIQNIIKLVGGLISGGAAGGTLMGGGGVGGVGSLPPSDTMIGSTTPQFGPDYYAAVQQYYNAYMPETPRNVVGPLQQWYENKFGA